MKKQGIIWFLAMGLAVAVGAGTVQRPTFSYPPVIEGARVETYKQADGVTLNVWLFGAGKAGDHKPAVVFFFGGGWQKGSPEQFVRQSKWLAERGMVAVVADYRVAARNRVKPCACVADARSCVRWLRRNAERLGIDPQRLAAGGGSAGGHLAVSTALLPGLDEPGEDMSVSCVPNAVVLFNPGLMMAPFGDRVVRGFGSKETRETFGCEPEAISPMHHIRPGLPPMLIMQGTADQTTPYPVAQLFCDEMAKAGNRCELVGYAGCVHGFYVAEKYDETLAQMACFFRSIGYLAPTER